VVGQPETRNFRPSAVKTQMNHVSGRKRLARTDDQLLSYVPMMVYPRVKTVCNLCGPASILGMSSSNRQDPLTSQERNARFWGPLRLSRGAYPKNERKSGVAGQLDVTYLTNDMHRGNSIVQKT